MTVEAGRTGQQLVAPRTEPSLSGGRDIRIGDVWLGELESKGKGKVSFRWRTRSVLPNTINLPFDKLSQLILGYTVQDAVKNKFVLEAEVRGEGENPYTSHSDRKVFYTASHGDSVTEDLAALTAFPSLPNGEEYTNMRANYNLGAGGGVLGFSVLSEVSSPSDSGSVRLTLNSGNRIWSPELVAWVIENNLNRERFGKIEEIDIAALCRELGAL